MRLCRLDPEMRQQVEETEFVISYLESRDLALIKTFTQSRKALWKDLQLAPFSAFSGFPDTPTPTPAQKVIEDTVKLYMDEIHRTEAEMATICATLGDKGAALPAILLDLGVDHTLLLLRHLFSKLMRVQNAEKYLLETVSNLSIRIAGYLTKYVC